MVSYNSVSTPTSATTTTTTSSLSTGLRVKLPLGRLVVGLWVGTTFKEEPQIPDLVVKVFKLLSLSVSFELSDSFLQPPVLLLKVSGVSDLSNSLRRI